MRPTEIVKKGVGAIAPVQEHAMTTHQLTREKNYRIAMCAAKRMLACGQITRGEYEHIDTIFARKFSPVWGRM